MEEYREELLDAERGLIFGSVRVPAFTAAAARERSAHFRLYSRASGYIPE